MAAVQQNIAYKRELMAGDIVEIRSRVLQVTERSVRFVHEMRDASTGEITATCELVGVHMDRTQRRACPLPEDVRTAAQGELAAETPASGVCRVDKVWNLRS
jgi:acyl-CoA thioester hydrolase